MNLSLKNLKFHEDMSEETPCFSADLYEDGKLVAHVKNSGQGGCNSIYSAKGIDPKYVQKFTDLHTDCDIMGLAEELNVVKKNQSNKLVLKKGDDICTLKYNNSFSKLKMAMGESHFKVWISGQVKKQEKAGYEVLNTNLGL